MIPRGGLLTECGPVWPERRSVIVAQHWDHLLCAWIDAYSTALLRKGQRSPDPRRGGKVADGERHKMVAGCDRIGSLIQGEFLSMSTMATLPPTHPGTELLKPWGVRPNPRGRTAGLENKRLRNRVCNLLHNEVPKYDDRAP